MEKLSVTLSRNRPYFTGYLILLLSGLVLLLCTSKEQSFLMLNPYHGLLLDWFFIIYTNVGDGLFSVAIFLVLLYLRKPLAAWEIIFTFLLSGLVAQVLKNFFPMPRPKTLLEHSGYPYFLEGITHVGHASFPSGHSASAFGLATILTLYSRDKRRGLLYLAAAAAVAYSRVYLGQHFLQDVLAGSCIGTICALSGYFLIQGQSSWFAKMKAADQSL